MIQKIFTVYDSKAFAFLPPFYAHEKGVAARQFSECANSDQHQFGKHPGDYTLFCIGEFDDQDGLMLQYDTKENMGLALSFIKAPEPDMFTNGQNSLTNLTPEQDSDG